MHFFCWNHRIAQTRLDEHESKGADKIATQAVDGICVKKTKTRSVTSMYVAGIAGGVGNEKAKRLTVLAIPQG